MPRIFGRDEEVAFLRAAWDEARSGAGRLVMISGEPGIGKSTLARAVADEARTEGAPVLSATAPEIPGAPPYWLWTQILRQLQPNDAIGGSERTSAPVLARILPELTDDGAGLPAPVAIDENNAERFRLGDAIASALLAPSEVTRLLILDDLHAADPSSLEVLAHLAAHLGQSRLLVIGTHRSAAADLTPALRTTLAHVAREATAMQLSLAGLDAAAVREQLSQLTGHAVPQTVAERVRDRSGGNPFFVGEIGHLLMRGAQGDTSIDDTVPPRVRDVLARRIDRLPTRTRAVLETAALIGRELPLDVLAAACDWSAASVLTALEPAVDAGLLQTRSTAHMTFAHALVSQAIAGALPATRAAQLHERIGLAIEATRATTLDDWLPALAVHWSAAEPTTTSARRAQETARLAALQAENRFAHEDAARLWRMSIEAAQRAGSATTFIAELQLGLARALFRSGDVAGSLQACFATTRDAEAAGRPELIAAAALILEGIGEPQWARDVISLAERALHMVPDDKRGLRARLHAQIGQLLDLSDLPDWQQRARRETDAAVDLAKRSGDQQALQAALQAQHRSLIGPEDVDGRLDVAARMVDSGRTTGSLFALLWGRLWTFDALLQLGRLAEAEAELSEAAPVTERLQWPVARWHLLRSRAAMLQAQGRFVDALRSAESAVAALSGTGLERAQLTHAGFLESQSDLVGDLPGGEERRRRMFDVLSTQPVFLMRLTLGLIREDQLEPARTLYARLPPISSWEPPRYVLLMHLRARLQAAIALGLRSDVEQLLIRFKPIAHWHVVTTTGTVTTHGSGFLYSGLAAGFLGDLNGAIEDIERAVDDNHGCGVVSMAIVASQELAEVLARRRKGSDVDRANRIATAVLRDAQRLGMTPFATRAAALLRELPRRRATAGLTSREIEVARMVAQGLTNRQLAVRLGISERTAETHVDHILSKLGFASRVQVAAWIAAGSESRPT